MNNELLPCPFCGSSDLELSNTHTPSFWVQCNGCYAEAHGRSFERGRKVKNKKFHYDPTADIDAPFDARTIRELPTNYQNAAASAIAAWNRRTHGQALASKELPELPEAYGELRSGRDGMIGESVYSADQMRAIRDAGIRYGQALASDGGVPEGFVMVPKEPTQEMLSVALSHLGIEGYWREDAKPIGSFYSGHTAAEAESVNWRTYGKARFLAAWNASLSAAPTLGARGEYGRG